MQSPEQNELFHRDPKNWKWGIFYYNPWDERLFLPKKNAGMGLTLNFAKREAYIFTVLILLIPVALVLIGFSK
jgi:uncharacterized membrane protein